MRARPERVGLVAARILQGLVAAPLVPLAMSMLLGRGPGDGRSPDGGGGGARSISPLAGIMLFLGPALGPTIGGVLIGAVGWRGIFLVNVPAGALAAVAVRFVPAALARGQLSDASTLFNTWPRVAGSFGIGLIAARYATQARGHGPVAALHAAGLGLAAIALLGALAAVALPAVRNTALSRG